MSPHWHSIFMYEVKSDAWRHSRRETNLRQSIESKQDLSGENDSITIRHLTKQTLVTFETNIHEYINPDHLLALVD